MRELWLLRHAEALPAGHGSDLERALNAHGQAQAQAVGRQLSALRLVPDSVLCSPARRTRETAQAVIDALPAPPSITFLDGIYDASAGELLALATQHGAGEHVLLVGHNPGLTYLAMALCPQAPGFRGMATATLARIALEGPAEPGHGRLLAIYTS
ncbi:MAG TPA: histidine phosphatase family protein [Rhodanobacteraceae bacterium]